MDPPTDSLRLSTSLPLCLSTSLPLRHLPLRGHVLFHVLLGDDVFGEIVDWIDPRTAEVRRVDGLEHTLNSHCSLQPDYISPNTSVIDAIFRVFLSNGNSPMTAEELAGRIGRTARTIQRTLSGNRVYKGILPVPSEGEE